ncbi:hypothetical protein QN277_016709 [Acacia crassicarpa]
MNPGL